MRRSPLFSFSRRRPTSLRCSSCRWVLVAATVVPIGQAVAQSSDPQTHDGSQDSTVADPYFVFVAETSAHLRCGPGGEYYRTDPLRHGQELEVYVEYADGWLGVRPTADSFCWIPAEATRILDDKTGKASAQQPDAIDAEIIEDKTKAWIGTNLGRARRSRWQVQLSEGEIITILGRSERDGPDGPQLWYRIVPPSGEFRWIHRDQVVTTAEALIAGTKPEASDESIEFLPSGPSSVANNRSEPDRVNEIASIRRLDEIEKHINERQRSRFDRLRQDESGTELASGVDPRNGHPHDSAGEHHPRSFSERVTDGLASLISGQQTHPSELVPLTGRSSRRPTELVPIIGSGLAETGSASANHSLAASPAPTPPVADTPPLSHDGGPALAPSASTGIAGLDRATMPADAKTVTATAHPEFRSSESQVAIMSAPRLVASVDASPLTAQGFAGQSLQPTKLRTITSEQIEGVQRSVAASTAESLPMIMSTLMARGASAPEMRIVADAAQRFSMNDLAQRARDYESLARRRDGDTLVATVPRANPPTISTAQVIPTPAPVMPTSHTSTATHLNPSDNVQQASVTIDPSTPEALEHSGVLVEVYSADPDRPPFAITDRGGRTLAYITPAPGVEIRNHLGSEIRVQGETGFLQGLDTPHVLVTHAERQTR